MLVARQNGIAAFHFSILRLYVALFQRLNKYEAR